MALQPDQLRCLVQDCIAKHLYSTAVFYADKLVTLTEYAPGDVYLLAQTYYVSRQFRRAVMLLKSHGVMEDGRFRYLAAKCLAEVDQWDECLTLLGDGELDDDLQESEQRQPGYDISTYAAVCLLRGRAFEALENRQRAIACYTAALQADPWCEEALSALIDNHMLTNRQELELIDSLPLQPQDRWLALLYRAKCKKYLQHDFMEAQLQELQQSPTAAAAGGAASPPDTAMDTPLDDKQQQQQQQQQHQHQQPPGGQSSMVTPVQQHQQHNSMHRSPAQQQQQQPSSPLWHALPGSPGPGCGLSCNADVLACRADWLFYQGRFEDAYQLTSVLLGGDPYATQALTTHLAAALQLGKKNELFLRAHKLVEEYPDSALAWFGVGCYYMAARQYEQSRCFFAKATQLDKHHAYAWICFGHAFAEQDESDQALAAYRTAARLFPGLHTPLLGMGCAYQRMNNLQLAERCLLQAADMCPQDPAVAHELGVLAYRNQQYAAAQRWFTRALELVPGGSITPAWEATVVNLAHALRKQQQYPQALALYEQAVGLNPHNPASYIGMAYTHQLLGNSAAAVEGYHKGLGLKPDDAFAAEMLTAAMHEECAAFGHLLVEDDRRSGADQYPVRVG